MGYAEVINAGKSRYNEDQASVAKGRLLGVNGVAIPYLYVGVFDGHGGTGAAIKVSGKLNIIQRRRIFWPKVGHTHGL